MTIFTIKKIWIVTAYTFVTISVLGLVGYGGYLLGTESNPHQAENTALQITLTEERATLSDHEVHIYLNAQALLGELGTRYIDEWPHAQSVIFTRLTDPRWPMSIDEVLLEKRPNGRGCMVDAMCDEVTENLLTDEGNIAREYAAIALAQFAADEFILTHSGHSWATPTAAAGHAYFEGLTPVAEGSGHLYFADAQTRPQARPDCLTGCIPNPLTRPKARPAFVPQLSVNEVLASLVSGN
jgi:hypothetical protein